MSRTETATDLPRGRKLLRVIGEQLDADGDLRTYTGGVVVPDRVSSSNNSPRRSKGGEDDEPEGQAGQSEIRPQRGAPERGARRRGGTKDAQAPLVSEPGLTPEAQVDLREAADAYPQMRVGTASGAAWLQIWVQPVPGLENSAYLLIQYPFDENYPVRAWGWWDSGIWIGPRHTNYPHGDICAYEPKDLTWTRSEPLVDLLDLYMGWIVRHLHLREFERWPGRQVLHTAYERLHEQEPGELCGCGEMSRYKECHQREDERMGPTKRYLKYMDRLDELDDTSRRPPSLATGALPSPEELAQPVAP